MRSKTLALPKRFITASVRRCPSGFMIRQMRLLSGSNGTAEVDPCPPSGRAWSRAVSQKYSAALDGLLQQPAEAFAVSNGSTRWVTCTAAAEAPDLEPFEDVLPEIAQLVAARLVLLHVAEVENVGRLLGDEIDDSRDCLRNEGARSVRARRRACADRR